MVTEATKMTLNGLKMRNRLGLPMPSMVAINKRGGAPDFFYACERQKNVPNLLFYDQA